MTNLITKEQAQKLSFLYSINDGFRLPDMAYIHGKDIQLMEELDGGLYFSNYWYGPKDIAFAFAEKLAAHFKKEYEAIPLAPNTYDMYGMVMFWDNGQDAMVGNINLYDEVSFAGKMPNGLVLPKELTQLLEDGSDNHPYLIDTRFLSDKYKKDLPKLIIPGVKLEKAKEIIHEMTEALGDYASICRRLDSEPLYGRDARNVGVEDGYSFAPGNYELERAKERAIDACRAAKDAGLINDIPYDLS
jgi:hypothetical protein